MLDLVPRIRSLPADTLTALAFFSRLPVRPRPGSFDLRQSAGAWPVAGLVLTLGPAALFVVARLLDMDPIVAALLALAAAAFLMGAMHEDGLADTADGFGGGQTRDEKLALMRDSRLGTFGALTLIFAILIKASSIGAIGADTGRGALAIVAAAVLSRSLALWHWSATAPARPDGMAASAGRPDQAALAVGSLAGVIAGVILLVVFGFPAILALLLAATAVRLFSSLAERQIGGHTGDTIGASQQIAETLLFAGLVSGSLLPDLR